MAYCIYLRKSRKDIDAEQQGAGETLARHRSTLSELAARRGLSVACIYEEIVSGDTIADRPRMQQLLSDVQAGHWEGVLVMEVERLARGDTIDQGLVAQTFKYTGTRIITPARDYDPNDEADEEYFEFGLFMSRREYKTTRRRLQAGRLASVREGKYLGTRAPFGYERRKLKGEKGWSLAIVPEKAEIVRMVFHDYLYGRDVIHPETGETIHETVGAQKIANQLNSMGVTTDLGHPWTANRIRQMLHEPSYIGMIQWYQRETKVSIIDGQRHKTRPKSDKYMLVEGRHEPIIDKATWQGVQTLFDGRKKSATSVDKEVKNPLNGLLKCAVCGKAMVRTPMYGALTDIDYIRCSTVGCPTSACPLSDVEQIVLDGLAKWVREAELGTLPEDPPDMHHQNAIRASTQRHLEDLQRRRGRLMDLLEQGVYDIATYTERNALLMRDIETTKAALAALPPTAPSLKTSVLAILPTLRHVLQAYTNELTPTAKNDLLLSVLEHGIYRKTHRCTRAEKPADFLTVDLYPKVT